MIQVTSRENVYSKSGERERVRKGDKEVYGTKEAAAILGRATAGQAGRPDKRRAGEGGVRGENILKIIN